MINTHSDTQQAARPNIAIFRIIMYLLVGATLVVDGVGMVGNDPLRFGIIAAVCAVMAVLSYLYPDGEDAAGRIWLIGLLYCLCCTVAVAVGHGTLATFLYYIPISGTTFTRGRREGFAMLGLATTLLIGIFTLLFFRDDPTGLLQSGIPAWFGGGAFMVLVASIAVSAEQSRQRSEQLVRQLDAANATLRDNARQLRAYATTAEELAVTRERNRIAREIHDSLGHYLTAINIQLETGLELGAVNPERANRSLHEAKRLASAALGDVRRSVAALHPAALDGLSATQAVTQVVTEFRALTDVPITLRVEGDDRTATGLPPIVLTLYRATQETLTNVRKHAHATHVAVTLVFAPDSARLTVQDDGVGLAADQSGATPQGGFGLAGLRERAALLGGSFSIASGTSGGTRADLLLPVTLAVSPSETVIEATSV